MPNSLSRLVDLVTSIAKLPVARLEFRLEVNPEHVEKTYKLFTKRHPRYKVIPNKSLGAALVPLNRFRSRHEYLETIKGHNSAVHHARKAKAKGYRLSEIDRNNFIDEIHEINTSVEIRQGQPMTRAYLEKQTYYAPEKNFRYYGAFNASGKLMAYSELGFYGNFASFNRVIGVRNNDGVMHLMVTEIVCQMIEDGGFNYLMYDTYFGASPGMKAFKTMLGFQPYRAKYSIK
jgi:transposase